MSKFTRLVEDFDCINCGVTVHGDGYTNHCPGCLTSLHVDNNPGDRASECGGVMEPINIKKRHGTLDVLHRCIKCGFERWNKLRPNDNWEAVYKR